MPYLRLAGKSLLDGITVSSGTAFSLFGIATLNQAKYEYTNLGFYGRIRQRRYEIDPNSTQLCKHSQPRSSMQGTITDIFIWDVSPGL